MNHVSTLRLHQLRLGELDAAERAAIEAHVEGCPLCAGRLGHQEAARAAFAATPIPAAIRALDAPPTGWDAVRTLSPAALWERLGRFRAALFLVPVAAAAMFALRMPSVEEVESPPLATERTKGPATGAAEGPRALHHALPAEDTQAKGVAPTLEAWIQTGQSARPVYAGEAVRPGTRVQLTYDPGHHRFVTLAGRDARGTVEVYGTLPAKGPGVAPAPFSLTLDDAEGSQEFFAILTDTKPEPGAVLRALSERPIRMEKGEIASVVLRKE